MSDGPDVELPSHSTRELSEEVGNKENRKVQVRRSGDQTLWVGFRTFGVIGWSIAVPTLIGIALGLWFDRRWPANFSWTLALLLGGVTLGCLLAWHWVRQERDAIEKEEMKVKQ